MSLTSGHESFNSSFISSSQTQVAAVYDSVDSVKHSIDDITSGTDIERSQITIVDPQDDHFSEKLEGASAPLGKKLWHSHLVLGGSGLLLGLVVAYLLVQFGPALTQNNPLFTYIALISPGLFLGLFAAGLMGIRPDRTEIIDTVRHAIRNRRYAIVVNMKSHQSVSRLAEIMGQRSRKVVEAIQS